MTVTKQFGDQMGPKMHQNMHFATTKIQEKNCGKEHCVPLPYGEEAALPILNAHNPGACDAFILAPSNPGFANRVRQFRLSVNRAEQSLPADAWRQLSRCSCVQSR